MDPDNNIITPRVRFTLWVALLTVAVGYDIHPDSQYTQSVPRENRNSVYRTHAHNAPARPSDVHLEELLDMHNVYRCMHGVPALEWDVSLANSAAQHAQKNTFQHSSASSRIIDGVQVGENIAWGYANGSDVTKAWYCEIDCTDPKGIALSLDDKRYVNARIGDYTQLVWKNTTKIGCAKANATIEATESIFWVCHYSPTGNVNGSFPAEVLAQTVDIGTCPSPSLHSFASNCFNNLNCEAVPSEAESTPSSQPASSPPPTGGNFLPTNKENGKTENGEYLFRMFLQVKNVNTFINNVNAKQAVANYLGSLTGVPASNVKVELVASSISQLRRLMYGGIAVACAEVEITPNNTPDGEDDVIDAIAGSGANDFITGINAQLQTLGETDTVKAMCACEEV